MDYGVLGDVTEKSAHLVRHEADSKFSDPQVRVYS